MILASTQWLVFSWKSWVEHSIITMRKRTNKPDVTAIITVTEWDSSCRCPPALEVRHRLKLLDRGQLNRRFPYQNENLSTQVFVNICCISGKLLFSKKLNSSSHLQSIYLNLTNSAGASEKGPLILKVKCQLVNLVAFDLSLCRQIVVFSCSGHLFRISGHSSKVYWAINDNHQHRSHSSSNCLLLLLLNLMILLFLLQSF